MKRRIKKITVADVKYTALKLAKKFMAWNEPIPEFETRYPNVLESCLAVPFQTYNRKPLYARLIGKAPILFYLMIKNHPFENGNKRIAVMALLLFLLRNNKWLGVFPEELYRIAVLVAESNPKDKDRILEDLKEFFEKGIVDF